MCVARFAWLVRSTLIAVGLLLALPAQAWQLQWFGQAAFRIDTPEGKVILIDPFISKNPKTPPKLKDLSLLGQVDLVLITHGHGDHVGDAAAIAKRYGAKVAMNADMGQTFATLGIIPAAQVIGFNKSGPIQPLEGVTVTMVRAEHSSELVHTGADGSQRVHPGGEPAGYIIELENGFTLYHAGDTGVFGDMAFIGQYYQPSLALLPIGGHFTMDPEHAAYAVNQLLKTPMVIPMHYATFPPLKGTPEQFKEALGGSQSKLVVMTPGESLSFPD